MENKANNNKTAKNVLSRFIIYTLVVFGFTSSLPFIIGQGDGDFIIFYENGPIEWLQFILLSLSVFIFLRAVRSKEYNSRELFSILSLTTAIAMIRELDLILDKYIPVFGWKLPAIFCVAAAIVIYLQRKNQLTVQIDTFIRTRSFSLLWCGFILAVPFAQLVGHGAFLQVLMGDDYVRDYKKVIEELGEMLGYLLILVGSLESVLQEKEDNCGVAAKMA